MFKFKNLSREIWAFDAEWAPDPAAGRLLYGVAEDAADREVVEEMWRRGGATAEEPRPYLKTVVCRVLSVSAVVRKVSSDGEVSLRLVSLPKDTSDPAETAERSILERFLSGLGRAKPILVGFNSTNADLKTFLQRGVVSGASAPEFCERPEKPWEGSDYFVKDYPHVDLFEILSGRGRGPSLNELAVLSGFPGKGGVDGEAVADLWLDGKLDEIVRYNEHDALTTYLVFLRACRFAGLLDPAGYSDEAGRVARLLEASAEPHLATYLARWKKADRDGHFTR